MTHEELVTKLRQIRPGANWNLRGNTYQDLEWLDDPATKPTAQEVVPLTAPEVTTAQRTAAVDTFLNDPNPASRTQRGAALVTMDELNLLRQWIMTFKAAVAAATTLADLKTRVAALNDLADRNAGQINGAIQNRINAGN